MKIEIIVNDNNKGFKEGQIKENLDINTCKALIELGIAREFKESKKSKTKKKD